MPIPPAVGVRELRSGRYVAGWGRIPPRAGAENAGEPPFCGARVAPVCVTRLRALINVTPRSHAACDGGHVHVPLSDYCSEWIVHIGMHARLR